MTRSAPSDAAVPSSPRPRISRRIAPLRAWFTQRGWQAAPFQKELWTRYLAGESGLLLAPTGSGKTLAAFGGPLIEGLTEAKQNTACARGDAEQDRGKQKTLHLRASASPREMISKSVRPGRMRLLWVSPLRALATDLARALQEPIDALGLNWEVRLRTGDASAREKRLARAGQAEVLVITPESLALMLSYPESSPHLASLRGVVVDEWHELMASKRGTMLQLCLARLRGLSPGLRIWGLSATIGDPQAARDCLLPHQPQAALVQGGRPRPLRIHALLPGPGRNIPQIGYHGLWLLPAVLKQVREARTSLLFTGTRAGAERWYEALASVWSEPPQTLALHHGSLDPKVRAAAEEGLRTGQLRCVVATSSLDLGVDFPAVDQVLQVGSPKGVARLLQRAGRARHRPGEPAAIACVATQALDLITFAAAREALAAGHIESPQPPRLSMDVLAQHCVTLALGGGFDAQALFEEVRGTHAFAELDPADWQRVLAFIERGGEALARYPDFQRVQRDEQGHYRVTDRRIAQRHRLAIGTIVSEGFVSVRLLRGGTLGSVEEGFISRLKRGEVFRFAGRLLELVRLEGMTALVRPGQAATGAVARWMGGRMPLSTQLAEAIEKLFVDPGSHPEMVALAPVLAMQQAISALPGPQVLLIEQVKTRRGHHLACYPMAGRLVHEGLAPLLALRLGRRKPNTFEFVANDFGLMLSSPEPVEITEALWPEIFSLADLPADLQASLNLAELARRQFREIARIAGLLTPSYPGRSARPMRQVQASSELIYDVLTEFDPEHLLLGQAAREALDHQLGWGRLRATLAAAADRRIVHRQLPGLSPLALPLWAESFRGQLSTEDWETRVRRAAEQMERRYGGRSST